MVMLCYITHVMLYKTCHIIKYNTLCYLIKHMIYDVI